MKKSKYNTLHPTPRYIHNFEALKMLIDEYKVVIPSLSTPYDQLMLLQRLVLMEFSITFLLGKGGTCRHCDLIGELKKSAGNVSASDVGLNSGKLVNLYDLYNPIITVHKGTHQVKLHPEILEAISLESNGEWRFNDLYRQEVFKTLYTKKAGNATDPEAVKLRIAEIEYLRAKQLEKEAVHAEYVNAVKLLGTATPAKEAFSKVARIEPFQRLEAGQSKDASKEHDTWKDELKSARLAAAMAGKIPGMKHKATMTRPDMTVASKAVNTVSYGRFEYHPPRPESSHHQAERLGYTRVFHCRICKKVPTTRVVLDMRCGRLIGCHRCFTKHKTTTKSEACLYCEKLGRYVTLTKVHKKLQEMDV